MCGNLESYVEGIQDRELYLVKHCTARDALIVFASCTSTGEWMTAFAIIGVATLPAFESISPFYRSEILQARLVCCKPAIKFY